MHIRNSRRIVLTTAAAIAGGVGLCASTAQAALVYALTDNNFLLRFDHTTPTVLTGVGPILDANSNAVQDLIGIDFRPSTGLMYGVGAGRAIYTIDPNTAVATQVGTMTADPGDLTAPFTALSGSRFGFDFNPIPDFAGNPSLRIMSNNRQNLRVNVNPVPGLTTTDTDLPAGANVVGVAYTNSGTTPPGATTLYGIDSVTDTLVQFTNPNAGTFNTVGPLGFDVSSLLGFDILFDGTNNAFAALQRTTSSVSEFYSINLGTGAATLVGTIEGGDRIDGITMVGVIPEPATMMLSGLLVGAAALRRRR